MATKGRGLQSTINIFLLIIQTLIDNGTLCFAGIVNWVELRGARVDRSGQEVIGVGRRELERAGSGEQKWKWESRSGSGRGGVDRGEREWVEEDGGENKSKAGVGRREQRVTECHGNIQG